MKITLISPMRNEAYMLPFFFRHYDPIVNQYVIFDNESTDPKCFELYKANPKVRVETLATGGKNDSAAKLRVRNETYKRLDGEWFIVCDADEFIWHPDLRGYLTECLAKGITLPKVTGFDMLSETKPTDDGKTPMTALVKHGQRNDRLYAKRAVFHRSVDIRYYVGCHLCDPKGNVVQSPGIDLVLLHYKYLEYRSFMDKMIERSKRLSATNLQNGWSYKTEELTGEGEKKWAQWFETAMREKVQVIP